MSSVLVRDDHVVVTPVNEVFVICDDCREAYLGPAYYLFESLGCVTTEVTPDGSTNILHMNTPEGCTGNLCPACAGPWIEPDVPNDPRRPHA